MNEKLFQARQDQAFFVTMNEIKSIYQLSSIHVIVKVALRITVTSEFSICPVVRHGNSNSFQNPPTVTNQTMEL